MNILLLRHGQTDANAAGVIQGHAPTPLNDLGRRQAQALAERLASWPTPIAALISSDLPRATQTARPIAAATGLALIEDPAWRERSFGRSEGSALGDLAVWRAASGEFDPPGAEPMPAFFDRIRAALLTLPSRFPGAGTVAVVTHGGPVRIMLRMLADGRLSMPPGHAPFASTDPIGNCSILHLRHAAGLWSVACVNDASHLDSADESLRDAG